MRNPLAKPATTPGQAVELALASHVVEVPVGMASAPDEATVMAIDPVAAQAFGITGAGRVDRKTCMRVPGIKRGRNLVAGTIGTLPLVCYRTTGEGNQRRVEPVRRLLIEQLDPRTTPSYTLTWTVDDLIFHGISWWRVTARDADSWPTAVERLLPERVRVDQTAGRVYVDGEPVDDADLIRFDGPDEGLLRDDQAGDVVRLALALLRSAKRNADDDVPSMILKLVQGAKELTPAQITELLDEWESAREQRRTAYANAAIEAEAVAYDAQKRQLTELGQYVASELARMLNLPASRIGAPQGSGMTYTSTESDRRDLVDTTLALYLTPIWQRLSMGDVTPHGQAVTFDLTAYLRGTTTELVKAGVEAIGAGITDAAEVRTVWLGLPPRTDLPAPTPALTPGSDTA